MPPGLAARSPRLCSSQATVCAAADFGVMLASENMRMPGDHFGGDRLHDVAEIEQPAFLGHAGVEDDLEQQVAQLVLQVGPVLVLDGAGDFIGFLDRVRRDGGEGLLACPTDSRRDRAAAA